MDPPTGKLIETLFDSGLGGNDPSYAWQGGLEQSWKSVEERNGVFVVPKSDDQVAHERILAYKVKRDTNSIHRGLFRRIVLVIDCSANMFTRDTDFSPDRVTVMKDELINFIPDFFDQNPLTQIAVVIMEKGQTRISCDFTSDSNTIRANLAHDMSILAPGSAPHNNTASLYYALSRAADMFQIAPAFTTKEIFFIWGAPRTVDTGDVFAALRRVRDDVKARVSVMSLAPEIHILKSMCQETRGSYTVALDRRDIRRCLDAFLLPPAKIREPGAPPRVEQLISVGFPTPSTGLSLCVCHGEIAKEGFCCPRCLSTSCTVPTDCKFCGIYLTRPEHIAQAYRHIFPVPDFEPEPARKVAHVLTCNGCDARSSSNEVATCEKCKKKYCGTCTSFIHEELYSCPGCCANVTST